VGERFFGCRCHVERDGAGPGVALRGETASHVATGFGRTRGTFQALLCATGGQLDRQPALQFDDPACRRRGERAGSFSTHLGRPGCVGHH
jgi:hypothetical protein